MTDLDAGFGGKSADENVKAYNDFYDATFQLMKSTDLKAFDLSAEPAAMRARYGKSKFGQGCLLARRLIENGVRRDVAARQKFQSIGVGRGFGLDEHEREMDLGGGVRNPSPSPFGEGVATRPGGACSAAVRSVSLEAPPPRHRSALTPLPRRGREIFVIGETICRPFPSGTDC